MLLVQSKIRLKIGTNEVNRMTFQFSHFSYPVYSSIRTMNMEGIAARGMYSRSFQNSFVDRSVAFSSKK